MGSLRTRVGRPDEEVIMGCCHETTRVYKMATKDVDDATGQRTVEKTRKRKDRADSKNQDMEAGSSLTPIAKKVRQSDNL